MQHIPGLSLGEASELIVEDQDRQPVRTEMLQLGVPVFAGVVISNT